MINGPVGRKNSNLIGIKGIMKIVVSFLLIINLSYSQQPIIGNVCQIGYGGIGSWFVLSVIFIFISFIFYLIVYFASLLLDMPVIVVKSKNEFVQVAATLVILMFIVGLVRFMCSFEPASVFSGYDRTCDYGAGNTNCNLIDSSIGYFKDLTTFNVDSLISVTVLSGLINNIANLKVGINIGGIGIKLKPFDVLNSLDSMTEKSQAALVGMMILVQTYAGVIVYAETAMLGYLLPLGILMRCFQPTRGFGGALIGLTISFLFIMPLMFVINDIAIGDNLNYMQNNLVDSFKPIIGHIKNTFGSNVNTQVDLYKQLFGIVSGSSSFKDLLSDLPGYFTNFISGSVKLISFIMFGLSVQIELSVFVYFMRLIAVAIVAGVILPVIDFAVIATSARSLTRLFGEQVDISNLTRMI